MDRDLLPHRVRHVHGGFISSKVNVCCVPTFSKLPMEPYILITSAPP